MGFGQPKHRRPDEDQRVMPLINVVFLLLIFFMVAGQLSKTDPIKIEPPKSDSDKDAGGQRVEILIAKDGRLLLGGEAVALADLEARISDAVRSAEDKLVHVKADGAARAMDVIRVMDALKAAGAEKVKLLTSAKSAP